jgi:hypothetical protein
MASTAAHLVDNVLPDIPLRQRVITFPQPLPRPLAWQPKLLAGILEDVVAALERHLRTKTRHPNRQPGILSFVQTFTGDLPCPALPYKTLGSWSVETRGGS